MYMLMLGFLVAGILGIVLLLLLWLTRSHIKRSPKVTVTITMAGLIFVINVAVLVKTYLDYKQFLAMDNASHRLIPNIAFAIFLDFTVLIIGGLFLYIANQLYLSDYMKDGNSKTDSKSVKGE